MSALLALLALTGGLMGCQQDPPLVVGAKPFAESRILGEALRQLAEQAGQETAALVACEDSWDCQHKLQRGEIHLMVDYTGTGLSLIGLDSGGLLRVREAYAPLGVRWLEPLGFDNGYRVLVPGWRAEAQGLDAISDLEALGPLTVTCPPEYPRRPTDGLASLLRRYGLSLDGEPLVIADPAERYRALLDGRAAVAIGYATDGALAGQPLVALQDDLGFFPPYDAAPVLNEQAHAARQATEAAAAMAGRLDEATMRSLNYQVEVEGFAPADAARGWLRDQGLLDEEAAGERTAALGLAVDGDDRLDRVVDGARLAARRAFPDQPVRLLDQDPLEALASGEARIAIVGAERFFRRDRRGEVQRESRAAAVAVLGTRLLHLIRREGATGALSSVGVVGRAGVQLGELLALPGAEVSAARDLEALLAAVKGGGVDAALILAEVGDPVIEAAFAAGGLALAAVDPPGGTDLAWLRPARIASGTYAGQAAAVETLSAQVVLAGATDQGDPLVSGGPAAALPSTARPLSPDQVRALAAGATQELPDPVLPSASGAAPAQAPAVSAAALDTVLNLLVLLFLGWLVKLALVPEPDR